METSCEFYDVACHFDVLVEWLRVLIQDIWKEITEAGLAAISAIPVPAFMSSPSFAIPAGVLWFAQALELPFGIGVMVAAWTFRFLIRRVPLFG